jgi:hypothetical protein
MTLEDYLDHLTEDGYHTLRRMIDLEQGTHEQGDGDALTAYTLARDYLLSISADAWGQMLPCQTCGLFIAADTHAEELGFCVPCQADYFSEDYTMS